MSLEIILNIEPLNIHITKLGLIAYKRLENTLDKVTWCTDPNKSHLQNLHTVITKAKDNRCDATICDRNTDINLTSFNGKPAHSKMVETKIYTDGSKTEGRIGSGFVLYHTNKRMHTESIHLPHTHQPFSKQKLKL